MIGAGAAGLATAIFARRDNASRTLALLDTAKKPGAKILVSGGSRCNVTNTRVTETDFWGGSSIRSARSGQIRAVRHILHAFPADRAIAFFTELGVPLHVEEDGKLFPNSNRSRDVLDALLRAQKDSGAVLLPGHRVIDVIPEGGRFRLMTEHGEIYARRVVLATGGRSLPKTGSDGSGLEIARRLGHTIVPTTPALAPLLLAASEPLHAELSGVSQAVELSIWIDGRTAQRVSGSMLWTHFGVSGPAALDASRHLLRAEIEGRTAAITVNFCGGASFDTIDQQWTALASERPRSTVASALASMMPAATATALLRRTPVDGGTPLAHLSRDDRRRLAHGLTAWPLPVTGTRGYNFAEVTAGGVALDEIDSTRMESRVIPGLYLVGEILDVDGRLGGFNFQWAWSTGYIAGTALARH